MSNTEKKLDALIDALGFDVEKTVDTRETPISKQSGLNRMAVAVLTMGCNDLATTNGNEYKRGDDDCYYLKASLDVDYKLTKPAQAMQDPILWSPIDGELFSLGCQVANDDIRGKLKLLGFELDRNQMHDVMDTIIFHIARN
jgi:hypothetical protein